MRISIVGPTFPYKGGIAQHTTELAHRMTASGHDVTIESWSRQYPDRLYPGQQRLERPEFDPFGNVNERLAWNRPDGWFRVGRRIGANSDVIVLVLTTPVQYPAYHAIVSAARSGRRRRRPGIIGIAHNVMPHEAKRVDPALVRSLLRRLDGLVAHSDKERHEALLFGAQAVMVAGLPFHFQSGVTAPEQIGPRPPARKLAFVGFVRPYKGLHDLIDAVASSSSSPTVIVRGEFWDDPKDYLDHISAAGVAHQFDLTPGYVDDAELCRTIDSSDALVLPYRRATGTQLPRIAFSRGTPVIATDVGDLAEQVRHGVDGLICEPNNVQSLSAAIDLLYTDDVAARLRTNVNPPDIDAEWAAYLSKIATLAARGDPASREP